MKKCNLSESASMNKENDSVPILSEDEARRAFLKKAGRFAAVTPPAITMLLGTSLNSAAIAKSGGGSSYGGGKVAGGGKPSGVPKGPPAGKGPPADKGPPVGAKGPPAGKGPG